MLISTTKKIPTVHVYPAGSNHPTRSSALTSGPATPRHLHVAILPCVLPPCPAQLGAAASRSRRAARPRAREACPAPPLALLRFALGEEDMGGNDAAGGEIDSRAPPPFGMAEIRAAIPNPCSVKDSWRPVGFLSLSLFCWSFRSYSDGAFPMSCA